MFKTAEELGIEPWERQRLEEMLTHLDTLQHVEDVYLDFDTQRPTFNMNHTASRDYDCGTVACIGGWCSLVEQGADLNKITAKQVNVADDYVTSATDSLRDLYFPPADIVYESVKPEQAKEAITNFLKTGDPQWDTIAGIEVDPDYDEE